MSSSSDYFPNYFSLEDIFVTQERVPCTVETNLPGMGILDPSAIKPDLEAGKKIELPLWYANQFDASRSRLIKVQIPDIYKKISKEICEADANAVDLGRMNKHFYEFGKYVTKFDRNGYIGPMLVDTCRQRSRHLMDLCKGNLNDYKNDTKLEHMEKELYTAGCKANQNFSQWLLEGTSTIKTAEMVLNHRKRKRAELEME